MARQILRITKHGSDRTRERIGIPKKAVDRAAAIAFEKGLKHSDTCGGLKRYLDYLYFRGDGEANNMRVYGDHIYMFHDTTLITVLSVPPEHRKQAVYLQRKMKG